MAVATAVAAVIDLTATGCILPPDGPDTDMPCATLYPRCSITQVPSIESAESSQSQAIEDFDTSTFVIDDPAELDRLEALLVDAGIQGDYRANGDACPGAITNDIDYVAEGATHTIAVHTCEPTEFDDAVTDLASEWRATGDFASTP